MYYKGQAERNVSGNFLEYVLVKACDSVFDRECSPMAKLHQFFYSRFIIPADDSSLFRF